MTTGTRSIGKSPNTNPSIQRSTSSPEDSPRSYTHPVKLYLDESVSTVLASFLSQQGVDCQTAQQAGRLGASDEDQLRHATRTGRAILTHDTRDFLRLAREWGQAGRSHSGIILSHQVPYRVLVKRLHSFLSTYQGADLTDQVLWLPPP
ncbi:MAG: DUF5615 family PIN-like protein [Nitrospirota bacterium]